MVISTILKMISSLLDGGDNINILRATQEDASRIKQLLDTNFDSVLDKQHSKGVIEKFRMQNSIKSISNQLCWKEVFVLREQESIVGTIALANFGSDDEPKYSISNLYIDVNEHGRGLGAKLTNHILRIAAEKELEILHVPSSRNAVSFYEKFGFVIDDTQPDAEDEITWMTKEL